MLRLLKGDWTRARSLLEHSIVVARTGNIGLHLAWSVASSAWILAQLGEASDALDRVREGEELAERQAASGVIGYLGWAYHALGRACLLLGRIDDAQRLGSLAVDASSRHLGFAAHAHYHLGLGILLRRAGDDAKASEYRASARAMYREMGMTFWLEQAEAALESRPS